MNFKEYYHYCKTRYKGNYFNKYPLDELTVSMNKLPVPEDYFVKIKNIREYCDNKIKNNEDLFDKNHKNIIKIIDLGNHFGKVLEENTYNCHCISEAVLVYKSLPNGPKRTSWIWHYDDNVNEQIKLIIYLNDVNKNTGAIQFLLKDDEGKKIKTSRLSPKINLKQVYYHSRIDNNSLLKFVSEGYKPTSLTGIAGTHCLFDPNCIHKATTPTEMPYRLCLVYNFRPYHKPVENRVTKKFTRSWSNLGHIKSYSTSVKT